MSTPDPRLDEIQARLSAATPGPWFREYGDVTTNRPDPRDTEEGYDDPRYARVVRAAPHLPKKDRQAIADAEFIANAPADVRYLLAELRKAREAVADAKAEAWDEAYKLGVDDERTSQANPGIAGCFCHGSPCHCFIAPARVNPYRDTP